MRSLTLTIFAALLLAATSVAWASDPARPALDEAAVLEALLEFDRPLHDELVRIRAQSGADDPMYQTRLQRARGRVLLALEHPDWAAAEARLAEVEAEVDRQVALYRDAQTDEEQKALHDQLEELASRAHDLRVDGFRFRIAILEMRLEEMEQSVRAREESRDGFIQEYLGRKLGR